MKSIFLLVACVALAAESRRLRGVSHPWLTTLATSRLNTGPTGSCVATTLGNMDRLGIPSFQGGTTADPNNSRGAMVQMVKAGRWKSLNLPGSVYTTIRSAYGTISAYVINADSYEQMAFRGEIPSGSIIFQTRHGWTVSSSASGNDMGIVRDGGRKTFNYQLMNPIIYSNAKEVVILVPSGASGGGSSGTPPSSGSSGCATCVKNGGGGGCVSRCSLAGFSCTNCLKFGGGKGCLSKCTSAGFDEYEMDLDDEADVSQHLPSAAWPFGNNLIHDDDDDENVGINWMTGCDRSKCPCGCEPCQSGLCRCYSWCRN